MKRLNSKTFRILFVCAGNSCRSPIAEGLLKSKLPDEIKDDVIIHSVGTLNLTGNRVTPFAIMAAEKLGANISQHRSKGITAQAVNDADIILVMDGSHKEYILKRFPEVRENVYLLKEFAHENPKQLFDLDIMDPIGSSLGFYEVICNQIDDEIDRILPTLLKLIQTKKAMIEKNLNENQ